MSEQYAQVQQENWGKVGCKWTERYSKLCTQSTLYKTLKRNKWSSACLLPKEEVSILKNMITLYGERGNPLRPKQGLYNPTRNRSSNKIHSRGQKKYKQDQTRSLEELSMVDKILIWPTDAAKFHDSPALTWSSYFFYEFSTTGTKPAILSLILT